MPGHAIASPEATTVSERDTSAWKAIPAAITSMGGRVTYRRKPDPKDEAGTMARFGKKTAGRIPES